MLSMERRIDFMQWFGADLCVQILMLLDDPADIIRASSVSMAWRQFVISNEISKMLCLKKIPEISTVAHAIDVSNKIEPVEVTGINSMEGTHLRRSHKLYAFLARSLTPLMRKDCILEAISASSTDNYPEESIQNTLDPIGTVEYGASYWSSKGESNSEVPETLSYKLISKLCVITEILVQPFKAYFQFGCPIYSAKAVRFRMGHAKFPMEEGSEIRDSSAAVLASGNDKFVWTYISPEFPMAQENRVQEFKLPEPAICIGGILQIELLGRVQKQETDGLYYICISSVQVVGRSLLPAYDIEMLDDTGKCSLKYYPEIERCWSGSGTPDKEAGGPSRFRRFTAGIRGIEQLILNTFLGVGGGLIDYDNDDDDADDQDDDSDVDMHG